MNLYVTAPNKYEDMQNNHCTAQWFQLHGHLKGRSLRVSPRLCRTLWTNLAKTDAEAKWRRSQNMFPCWIFAPPPREGKNTQVFSTQHQHATMQRSFGHSGSSRVDAPCVLNSGTTSVFRSQWEKQGLINSKAVDRPKTFGCGKTCNAAKALLRRQLQR